MNKWGLSRYPLFLFCVQIFNTRGFHGNSVCKEYASNAGDPGSIPRLGRFAWRRDRLPTPVFLGFPGDSDGKESACNVGDLGSFPGLGRSPAGGHGNPLQFSCLENPHEQRSLVGYSPWGRKESDMTEQLSTVHSTHSILRAKRIADHILSFQGQMLQGSEECAPRRTVVFNSFISLQCQE